MTFPSNGMLSRDTVMRWRIRISSHIGHTRNTFQGDEPFSRFSNGYAICVFGLLFRGRERMTTKMTTIEGCIDNRKKR